MSLDLVYAASLGLLIKQLREKAPMPDILASVTRLCTLARVGSVTIRAAALDSEREDSVGIACRLLHETLRGHGIEAIDISTTVTDAEFLKLAGILVGAPSGVPGSILKTAEAMSIWSVRLHASGATSRPVPLGQSPVNSATPFPQFAAPSARPTMARAAVAATSAAESELAQAIQRGEGRTVCELLTKLPDQAFTRVATPQVLHVVVEQVLESAITIAEAQSLLNRAGVAGARAVFAQLVAATDTSERRMLYDLAARLSGIGVVASEHARDERWYVVRNAAGLMGETRSPDMINELGKLLRHKDERVRIAAVVALGQINDKRATSRLESVLFDPSTEVRNRALALVFGSAESDPVPPRVLMALEEDNPLEYRLEMVAALAHLQTPRARARLEALARKPNSTRDDLQVRLAAIAALSSGHRAHAVPLLTELLKDTNPQVREKAAAVLAA